VGLWTNEREAPDSAVSVEAGKLVFSVLRVSGDCADAVVAAASDNAMERRFFIWER